MRAFSALGKVLAGAANSIERDEQLRIIADRLRLSPENVAYLMKSVPLKKNDVEGETRLRVLSHEEIAERSFLSLCLAKPGEARRYLQLMSDAHFTTDATRAAFNWVRDKVAGKNTGSGSDAVRLPMDSKAREVLPELIVRSKTESTAPQALPEYYFRLCEAELSRRIGSLKSSIDNGDENDTGLKELYRLEARRRDIRNLIQSGSYETA